MADAPHGAMPMLKIDGAPMPDWAVPLLERTVFDSHVLLPDVLQLRFRDNDHTVLKRLGVKLGSKVDLSATAMDATTPQPLVVAEVTAFEHEHGPGGSHAVLHCYDLSHRLSRGTKTRTWNDTTDSAIVQDITKALGIEADIDSTSVTYPQVSQINCTDWEFLRGRAAEIGYEVALHLGKLTFKKPTRSADAPAKGDLSQDPGSAALVVGTNLKRFHPRLTGASQVKEVEVRGWDPVAKKALSSRISTTSTQAAVALSQKDVVGQVGGDVSVKVDHALSTQAEVEAAAHAWADVVGGAHIEADGVAIGDPKLVAGTAVSISLAGWPYDGTYTLTSARHVYDGQGYSTQFVCSGRQERSLLGLATIGATQGTQRASGALVHGVVIGQVSNIDDPEKMGRVQLMLPWLDDRYVGPWARVAMPGAGPDRGLFALPEKGDEVLVAFDHGDTRLPYVVGMLWNGQDKAPMSAGVDGTQVGRRGFVSRKGHALVLDEEKGIDVFTSDKKVTVHLDSGGKVEISAQGDVTITSKGNVSIESQGDMTLKATGSLELDGQSVKVSSQSSLSLSGSAGATLDGGPSTVVKGGTIALN